MTWESKKGPRTLDVRPLVTDVDAAGPGAVRFTCLFESAYVSPLRLVEAVCPGLVNTPLAADLMADEKFVAATRARIPLGRIMEPQDIAGPAVFLLSEASSGITGIALPVDGGVTAE